MIILPGILATGSRSAMWYYNQLQRLAQEARGADAVFPVKILQMPFEEINRLLPFHMKEAATLLIPYLQEMHRMGARPFILANITLHEALDLDECPGEGLEEIIHVRGLLAAHFRGLRQKVALLGTAYTMRAPYMTDMIRRCGQDLIELSPEHRELVDRLRLTYYAADQPESACEVFHTLSKAYPHIQCFVLACTELSLALERYPAKERFVDVPSLQCAALYNAAAKR
jgi:aspartate/glutamate racemase